jgi:SAM-dependent methyltransferase
MNKDIFTEYYNNNSWNGKESVSGPGSDYEQTKYLILELQVMLKDLNIKTILDAPCGDFNWMRKVDLDKISYIGGDIVDMLVKTNNKKYKTKNISFKSMDIVNDDLPEVDLIMVRDCFVHLPNKDIKRAINNIIDSKSKYLLTTNFMWKYPKANTDISVGGWRRLNLEQEPFNFPFPMDIIIEGNIQSYDRDKTMSLWHIKDLRKYDV